MVSFIHYFILLLYVMLFFFVQYYGYSSPMYIRAIVSKFSSHIVAFVYERSCAFFMRFQAAIRVKISLHDRDSRYDRGMDFEFQLESTGFSPGSCRSVNAKAADPYLPVLQTTRQERLVRARLSRYTLSEYININYLIS